MALLEGMVGGIPIGVGVGLRPYIRLPNRDIYLQRKQILLHVLRRGAKYSIGIGMLYMTYEGIPMALSDLPSPIYGRTFSGGFVGLCSGVAIRIQTANYLPRGFLYGTMGLMGAAVGLLHGALDHIKLLKEFE